MHSAISSLVAMVAQATPDAIAIQGVTGSSLSYGRLFTQITAIAEVLRGVGIQRQDRVALVVENGVAAAVGFLAIAASATCAPLNPQYQVSEFEFYLSDLEAKALIVVAGQPSPARAVAATMGLLILELVPQSDLSLGFRLEVSHSPRTHSLPSREATHSMVEAEDVALILHTSGTTARPKIVPLTHHNLLTSAANVAATLQLQPTDCCLNVMPLFHIHGLVAALLASLSVGGRIVCTPGLEATKFFAWLDCFRPTWYTAVPTIHQVVLAIAEQEPPRASSLRFLRSSSAAMPAAVMTQLEQLFQAPLIEAYGMTEAAHQMTSNPLPPLARKPRSVGIAHQTEVAIAAIATNQLLPQGVLGEVVIRGEAVIQGYANHPEANAKAFFDGWFRTGDQGYLDDEGYLFLQGRLKEIVNRGGEKISPLEVDEALMSLPQVHQAVAFAVPHSTLGEDLVAAVVLKPNILQSDLMVTPEALRTALFGQIADFKVPSQIILVDSIPKGPTGKLQRLGLGQQMAERLQVGYASPQTSMEKVIAEIISEVLERPQVGRSENFFALGGDSLKGMQVASRLSTRLGMELLNTVIFRHPTVAQLAIAIAEQQQACLLDADTQNLLNELQGLSPENLAEHLRVLMG